MKKIIGFIPTPAKSLGFGIPVYADYDDDGGLYFHSLDEQSKIVVGFTGIDGQPVRMLQLPPQFHKSIDIGSSAIFVISGQCEIFVGNRDDLQPYFEVIANKSGKNFIEELRAIF